jgi:Rps23 Pro-64 3,4-dihydroxylase Tpa1-like proline 4-hydroxylase
VNGLIRPSLIEEAPEWEKRFRNAQPFRHFVVDNFLTPEFCDELRRDFPAFDPKQALNEFGEVGGKAVVEKLPNISPNYRKFDELIQSRQFLDLIGKMTGIPDLLYDPQYFGGGTHENRSGQDLDIHIDFNYHPVTRTHRRLNLIIFLNPEWDESWGGCLELHKDPWGDPEKDFSVSVAPLLNRCVVFETTENSWHGFRRIQIPAEKDGLSRRSIAIYFYTKQRPPEETAPGHSTVYVPWRLPEYFQPGMTLSEADLQTIRVLLRRRDDQIRFLYEREKEFSHGLEFAHGVINSKAFKIARLLTAPVRKVKERYGNRAERRGAFESSRN